jgi:hypothetical protein
MKKRLTTCLLMAVLFLGGLFSLQSCVEPPPDRLSSRQRTQVDTIFSKIVSDLRAETDSLCEVMMETQLQAAVDSIVQVRREEEMKIRRRLMKNE